MIIKSKRQEEVEFTEDVLCNKCGNSLKIGHFNEFYGLVEVEFSTGYFSNALPDGMIYSFSLCEPCLEKLFKEFKLPPTEKEYI